MHLDPALALDFVNSSAPPGGGPDLWTAPKDVPRWLAAAGLIPSPTALSHLTLPEQRLLLDHARRLRRALAELVDAWTAPGSPSSGMALLELNRFLGARPSRALELAAEPRGYVIHERAGAASTLGMLAPVAEAGALLLSREDPTRIRRCAATGCDRWFLDTSRNQRRRWCSMSVCGNRAKVAAHHRRARNAED